MERPIINTQKLKKTTTVNTRFNKQYGKEGTASRNQFIAEANAFYTGQLLKEARKQAGITQEELANRLGANKSYISRIENGKTEPKVSTFYKILNSLGLTVCFQPTV